jgi:hypothetical protein
MIKTLYVSARPFTISKACRKEYETGDPIRSPLTVRKEVRYVCEDDIF